MGYTVQTALAAVTVALVESSSEYTLYSKRQLN